MNGKHSIAAHWPGAADISELSGWARELRLKLGDSPVSLGLVFMTPKLFSQAEEILEILRLHARIPLLAGCSSTGLVANGSELENAEGLVLALYSLPGATLKAVRFTQEQVAEAQDESYWLAETGIAPSNVNGWLAFIDPFHLDSESWLRFWNKSYPAQPVFGGLAGGQFPEPMSQIYLDGAVHEDGGVAIAVGGDVDLAGTIAQGCTPIGEAWTLTRVEKNLIRHIANRPAYTVLTETVHALPPEEQIKAQGNLLIGLAANEYLEDFHRGDFVIRNLIGGDPNSGVLAVGALPRAGQTIQFQRRDAAAATEDMRESLSRTKEKIAGAEIYGACVFSCNGRGSKLFSKPGHDAALAQEFFGPVAAAGFFCNGEIGPVAGKNFLHSHAASLALFVKKQP